MKVDKVSFTIEVDKELYEKYEEVTYIFGHKPEDDLERFMRFFVGIDKDKFENLKKQRKTA